MAASTPNTTAPKPLESLSDVLLGALVVALIAAAMAFSRDWPAAVGMGMLILLASFAVGSFMGFLFGVPRVLSRDNGPASGVQTVAAGSPGSTTPSGAPVATGTLQGPVLQSNTNLERISDWLTTMIVGATLVELHNINDLLLGFRVFLEDHAKVFQPVKGVANAGILPAVGPLVLILGAVAGFLFMYLNTRLILIRLFFETEEFLAGREQRREFLAGPGQPLTAETSRTIQELVAGRRNTLAELVPKALRSRRTLSIQEALELMRTSLNRDGYDEAIQVGATLASTPATSIADYWYLLAAAFGQQYAHADTPEAKQSARDNALDAVRRAISTDPSYRIRLKGLTDPNSFDNDLAELYADDLPLRRILDMAQA